MLGVCKDDSGFAGSHLDRLDDQLRGFFRSFGNELFNREVLYYRHLLKGDISEFEFDKIIFNLTRFEEGHRVIEKVSRNSKTVPKEGLAVLDSRTERFYVTKACSVIGREPSRGDAGVRWAVDIPVKNSRKCSKQHALILYNFETNKFEVKCISAKNSVEVDGRRVGAGDAALPLDNGAVLTVGGEQFHFFVAKGHQPR